MKPKDDDKNQDLADMIADALIDAGLLKEDNIDKATDVILQEIIVRDTIESNREKRRQ